MAEFALTPGAPRAQEFRVTGSEYVGPIVVGRKRVMRITYDPGNTSNKGGSAEYTTEVTQVVNLAGAFLYTVRDSDGDEYYNFLDADGISRVGANMKSWKVSYREGRLLLPFPPCPGITWKNQWIQQTTSGGAIWRYTETSKIESVNESVSTPAGNFAQALKEVRLINGVEDGSNRTTQYLITNWWVPGSGAVRSIQENPQTKERWVTELLSATLPTP